MDLIEVLIVGKKIMVSCAQYVALFIYVAEREASASVERKIYVSKLRLELESIFSL